MVLSYKEIAASSMQHLPQVLFPSNVLKRQIQQFCSARVVALVTSLDVT